MGKYSKSTAIKIVSQLVECGKLAGIHHAQFIGYGTMLGHIREGGPIGHDSDTDMCILSDKITAEQEMRYYDEINKMGLFGARRKTKKRLDTNRYLWISVRESKKKCKSCNWFQQKIEGYYYHSKGDAWIKKLGPRLKPPVESGEAIMKGVRAELMEDLIPIDFCGVQTNIPRRYGELLDVWYPDWAVPRKGGASKEEIVLIVDKWREPEKWTKINRWR